MRKISLLLLLIVNHLLAAAQVKETSPDLIPLPVNYQKKAGFFDFNAKTVLCFDGQNNELKRLVELMKFRLERFSGLNLKLIGPDALKEEKSSIELIINKIQDNRIGSEGYYLEVNPGTIKIKANQPSGLFYGLQTLWQLFPPTLESQGHPEDRDCKIKACSIVDYPRFAWRGLMLDVSRHFFTKDEVKRFIDDMVKYKFNRLHWHLTDDQGWRLEIKSLPKLTEIGAWRVPRVGRMSQMSAPLPNEPRSYGGYYTQEDVKEIVQYAKDRFVEILPEIDVPGHSMAFVASYPEMSATPGNYRVNSGEKLMNWFSGGFEALMDNALNPASENTYLMLDKVFSEVAQLFPFEFIHMGGDECAKNFWSKSEAIRLLMQKEKLKDLHEVQSYFVKRVEKIISSKGKKLMGWDEILEGGLPENAAVMSWRGEKGGIEASKMNHPVVMSPTTFAYLDYNQGEAFVEPPIYANLRLNKAYQFEPIPNGAVPEMILGGQANLWTEQVPSLRAAQYMIWPRALAISESVWSPKEIKNWPDFHNALNRILIALTRLKLNMQEHCTILSSMLKNPGTLPLQLTCQQKSPDLRSITA